MDRNDRYLTAFFIFSFPSCQIYKSTKCNDMQQSGTCPRGPFCAFAHLERKHFSFSSSYCLLPFLLLFSNALYPVPWMCVCRSVRVTLSLSTRSSACLSLCTDPSINEEIQQVFLNPSSPLPSGTMMEDTGQGSPGSPQGCIGGAPFAPSSGACIAEQGLRGRLLGEDSPSLDAPLTPWVGDGGYGRAPGFEREDQVGLDKILLE